MCARERVNLNENFRLRLFSIVCASSNAITSETKIKRINPSASFQFAVDKYIYVYVEVDLYNTYQHSACGNSIMYTI